MNKNDIIQIDGVLAGQLLVITKIDTDKRLLNVLGKDEDGNDTSYIAGFSEVLTVWRSINI